MSPSEWAVRAARPVRTVRAAALVGVVLVVAGCATPQRPDPLEGWNRQVFSFNESVDAHVVRPVAKGYRDVTPQPVRTGVGNFFGNLRDIWSTINLFLQGRLKDGAMGIMRVSINTTLGLGGLIDLATPMQIDKPNEDFGQTLGVWGVKPGAYIVWPLLGPSTLRDSVGIPGDMYFSASGLATEPGVAMAVKALEVVDIRARYLGASNLLDDVALDKYSFMRAAYLQRRQNLIYEGNPPDEPMDEDWRDDPEEIDAPEPAGSAPSATP
ncbi:VacJ family lipoprotein [Aquabacterium fontiphilum]|nr:VacJ family lipoprotein [Aquabacterium fontiphilum]